MRTERQKANLRRGGGTPESAARAREVKAANREEADRLEALARENGWDAYSDLHAVMARHLARLLRREEQAEGKPSPEVTGRLKELRMGLEALTAYRNATSTPLDGAETFFATLESRGHSLLRRLEPHARPLVSPPKGDVP